MSKILPTFGLAATCTLLLLSRQPVCAEKPVAAKKNIEQSGPLGLAVELGFYRGLFVGAELSTGTFGVRVRGGYNPIVLIATQKGSNKFDSLSFSSTGQVDVDVFALPIRSWRDVRLGVAAGFKYNSLLGSGFGGAIEAMVARSAHVSWHVMIGSIYYPSGGRRFAESQGFPTGLNYNIPFGAGFQGGTSFAIVFHP